jgi:hypothetical protein
MTIIECYDPSTGTKGDLNMSILTLCGFGAGQILSASTEKSNLAPRFQCEDVGVWGIRKLKPCDAAQHQNPQKSNLDSDIKHDS